MGSTLRRETYCKEIENLISQIETIDLAIEVGLKLVDDDTLKKNQLDLYDQVDLLGIFIQRIEKLNFNFLDPTRAQDWDPAWRTVYDRCHIKFHTARGCL